jgi:hypothetical protein
MARKHEPLEVVDSSGLTDDDWAKINRLTEVRGMNEDDDEGAQARRYTAEALSCLAEVADSPNADPTVREQARKELEKWLVRLKELGDDPHLAPDIRRDLENALRRFRHS